MEEQSNSDLEQMKPGETLTYMVGHWRLPATPSLNLVASIPGLVDMYLIDVGDGELSLHSDIKHEKPGTVSFMKNFEKVFLSVVLGLFERGMTEVKTFVDPEEPKQARFCEFFGFEPTGYIKIFITPEGKELIREEMVYKFPIDEDEGNRD